jgi:hypothetical protein
MESSAFRDPYVPRSPLELPLTDVLMHRRELLKL